MGVMSTSEKLSYLDTSLSFAERAKDLVGRLTLDEKVSLMNYPAQGVPRFNIPAYNYWSEALHGVGRNGRATVFPQAIGMAATWDKELIQRVASAIGDEGRAKYHAALRRNGYTDQYQGLTRRNPQRRWTGCARRRNGNPCDCLFQKACHQSWRNRASVLFVDAPPS